MIKSTDVIENLTFDEIEVGKVSSLTRRLDQVNFGVVLAQTDPRRQHADRETAAAILAPGGEVLPAALPVGLLVAQIVETRMPGPGSALAEQTLRYLLPVGAGDALTISVTVTQKQIAGRRVTLDVTIVNQSGVPVVTGQLVVIAPARKIRRPINAVPAVVVENKGAKFRKIIAQARALPPIATAVVFPVETNSVKGAVEAAQANLIVPVFIGPKERILAAADGVDISPYQIIDISSAKAAAGRAVALAGAGKVQSLMKGSLHTDLFLEPILLPENGLHRDRRISHVFVIDVPTLDRTLFVTDGAINISPTLSEKRDIVQNAIDMAHALGIEEPKVAALAAVETVNPKMPATIDAAALSKMAARGQISGGLVDGPLAFDNAISLKAAQSKHIRSAVAGRADVLMVPDIESGNMLAKQLEYLAGAEAAGVVIGTRLPVILTSRADSADARMASAAVAALVFAHENRKGAE